MSLNVMGDDLCESWLTVKTITTQIGMLFRLIGILFYCIVAHTAHAIAENRRGAGYKSRLVKIAHFMEKSLSRSLLS